MLCTCWRVTSPIQHQLTISLGSSAMAPVSSFCTFLWVTALWVQWTSKFLSWIFLTYKTFLQSISGTYAVGPSLSGDAIYCLHFMFKFYFMLSMKTQNKYNRCYLIGFFLQKNKFGVIFHKYHLCLAWKYFAILKLYFKDFYYNIFWYVEYQVNMKERDGSYSFLQLHTLVYNYAKFFLCSKCTIDPFFTWIYCTTMLW